MNSKIRNICLTALIAGTTVGCGDDKPNNDTPERLISAGEKDGSLFYFVQNPNAFFTEKDNRLHVKTPDGNNLIFIDWNGNKDLDKYPNSFTPESAKIMYNKFVPDEYKLK